MARRYTIILKSGREIVHMLEKCYHESRSLGGYGVWEGVTIEYEEGYKGPRVTYVAASAVAAIIEAGEPDIKPPDIANG